MLVSEVGVAFPGLHVDPLNWAEGLCWWCLLCPLGLPVLMNVWSPWEIGSQTSDSVPLHPHKEWALLLWVHDLCHDAHLWALALPWLITQVSTPGDGAGGLDPEHVPFPPDQAWERPRTSIVWKYQQDRWYYYLYLQMRDGGGNVCLGSSISVSNMNEEILA